jgi:hypothetical protein
VKPGAAWRLALALLAGCGGAPTAASTTPSPAPAPAAPSAAARADEGRVPTRAEVRTISALLDEAARLRRLRFRGPVTLRVQSSAAIARHIGDSVDDAELVKSRALYLALGLLPPDIDLRAMLFGVLGEQVVGYYDTERGLLVVRDDALADLMRRDGPSVAEGRMVVVHESIHALQDQHFDLRAEHERSRTIDEANAFRALVEGDATLAMVGHQAEQLGASLRDPRILDAVRRAFAASLRRSESETTALSRAPDIVRIPLVAAYAEGLGFCARLFADGGWRNIDAAYARLPASSEEILHPEVYVRGERAHVITVPPLPALRDAGYATVAEDVLGELEMGVYFGLALPQPDAKAAAAGWDGDRLLVVQQGDAPPGAVWLTHWDSLRDADEAGAAARAVRDALPEPARARADVVVLDRHVLLLRGLPPALHAPVVAAVRSALGLPASAAPTTPLLPAPTP